MKVTVIRSPPIDAADTTPPPGRAVRVVGDDRGFAIDGEAPRAWSAARFVTFLRSSPERPPRVLMMVEGRRRPLDLSDASFDGPVFRDTGGDVRQAIARLLAKAPHLVIDRGAFRALRGEDPGPAPGEVRAYLAAVQRSLADRAAKATETQPVEPHAGTAGPSAVARETASTDTAGIGTASTGTVSAGLVSAGMVSAGTVSAGTVSAGTVSTGMAVGGAAAKGAEPARRCPHCDHPRSADAETCERCGIIFAKVDGPAGGPASAAAASQALPDLDLETEAPAASASDSALRAENLAATVLGLLRRQGSALMRTAAAAVAPWVLAGVGVAIFVDPLGWRLATVGLIAVLAYVHAMTSLTASLHAIAGGRAAMPVGDAFGAGLRRLPALGLARLLASIPILLGLAAFLVPGFVFALRAAFLETVATVEREPPSGIGWNQVSANVSDGMRLSVAALLGLTLAMVAAAMVVPACAVWIGAVLELVDPSAWLSPSPGAVLAALAVFAWICFALAVWASVLYLLLRELAVEQGPGLWNSASRLSTLTKVVLLVDLFLLLVALVRASRLSS